MDTPNTWTRSLILRRCGAALLLALSGAAFPVHSYSAAELYARLAPSVWVVHTYDKDGLPLSLGSAVVVGAQSLVTNCHVLRKAKRVEVTHETTTWLATLELWDTARDLCQIKAAGVTVPAVPMGEAGTLVVGQPVYALGSPAGLELTLSAGIVSALRRDDTQRLAAIQTSAAISQGSSGGGLFDEQGRLIGITSAFIGGNAQNLNLALPVEMVRELPQRHAAAQQAKLNPGAPVNSGSTMVSVAPSGVPRQTPPASVTGVLTPLAGQWSGEYRCGAYVGSGKVEHPTPWRDTVLMTVASDGAVSIVRGSSNFFESVTGDVQPDLSITLKGQGMYKATPNNGWITEVTGRFVAAGKDMRFAGQGEIRSTAGERTRDCMVTLTKNSSNY